MRGTRCYFVMIALLLLAVPVAAFDLGQVKVNGFLSQGYINSQKNNFLGDTIGGSTEYNDVGLTVTSQVNDQLRLGMQFLSRDLGPEGNNEIRLDWAFADYKLVDQLGVRLGKVKLPFGLYNEGRDSDFLRMTAFLPQSLYDESRRAMLVATQGGGVYGNLSAGVLGDFDYQFAYGETNFPDDSVILDGFIRNYNKSLPTVAPPTAASLSALANKVEANNQYLYAGNLIYNTPLAGLRFAGSYVEGKTELQFYNLANAAPTGAGMGTWKGEVGLRDMWVVSGEYTSSLIDLVSEYSEYKNVKKINGTEAPSGTSLAWYGLLAVHATEALHLYGVYDVFYADKDDHKGSTYAPTTPVATPASTFWRKDLGVGVRYDINPNWLIKAEWHDVNGVGSNSPLYNDLAGLKEDWNYYVVKTSFNF